MNAQPRFVALAGLAGIASFAALGSLRPARAADAGDGYQTEFNEDKADLGPTGKNPYFILEPGYYLKLEGKDHGKKAELLITVLDETRDVDGVKTRVVEERETVGDKVVEISLNFFAISKKTQSVYYFGEETFKHGGKVKAKDSWLAGEGKAKYAMAMPGKPEVGSKYYQENAPGAAMDRAEIKSLSETLETPAGKFDHVLKIAESTPLEPDDKEIKLYAEGVGLLTDEGLKLTAHGYLDKKPTTPAAPVK